jgi:hypothetical protein
LVRSLQENKYSQEEQIYYSRYNFRGKFTYTLKFSFYIHSHEIILNQAFIQRIYAIQKINRKDDRVVRATKRNLTTLVALKRWPQGGMPEFNSLIDKELLWAQELINSGVAPTVAEARRYVDLIVATLYTKSPQGRGPAWGDIKVAQFPGMFVLFKFIFTTHIDIYSTYTVRLIELMAKGHTTSTKFKTAHKYQFQPCPIEEDAYWLFVWYWNIVRPVLARGKVPLPTDPLLLNADGGLLDVGRRVQAFFGKQGFDISITTLRGLVETSAEQALLNGDISSKERESISAISTHSSEVCVYDYSYKYFVI